MFSFFFFLFLNCSPFIKLCSSTHLKGHAEHMEILHPPNIHPGHGITFCRDESFDTEGVRAKNAGCIGKNNVQVGIVKLKTMLISLTRSSVMATSVQHVFTSVSHPHMAAVMLLA